MVIEIDGAATHDLKIEKDELRQKHLELLGIKIVRFRDSDIRYNLSSVIENIKSEISRLKAPSLEKRE
jgi:very-short-patch-repair endonuclease